MQLGIILVLLGVCYANMPSRLPFVQYCTYYGYPVQQHIVHTQDGYNLKYFRIQAKNSSIVPGKKVIYLHHGFVDSADTWVTNEEQYAPGFYYANAGFDVWLGNSRGNRYSNPQLSPKVRNYWDFSFDEMAKFDLPAGMIYINKITSRRIHYVGHSQGTLIMFIALSQKYFGVQQTIASYCALGPIAYLKNIKSKLMIDASKTSLGSILKDLHVKKILLLSQGGLRFTSATCQTDRFICAYLLTQISQMDNSVNNLRRLPVIMGHFPAGSSLQNALHFQQYIRKDTFNMYDYGAKGNKLHYNSTKPPNYNLSNINYPCHLFVGNYDKLADIEDSQRIFKELINSPNKTMTMLNFGHATFIWGINNTHLQRIESIIEAAEPSQLPSTPIISQQ